MATVRTLSPRVSLIAVRSNLARTFRCLENHPLTGALATSFKPQLDAWPGHFQTELDLQDRVDDGQVAAVTADDKLKRFSDRISKEILTITRDDRNHPLYRHYIGNKPLHVFKRLTLGYKLEAMRKWIPSLAESEYPSLKALVPELTLLIAEADQAVRDKAAAEEELANFRDIGGRKRYVDEVNAARKELYGVLSTLPHKHAGLPSNFADGFFRRSQAKEEEEEEEPTIESAEEEISALKAELAGKEQELAALHDAAKEAVAKEEQRAEQLAKLAAMEAELAAKKKEADALRAAIGVDEEA